MKVDEVKEIDGASLAPASLERPSSVVRRPSAGFALALALISLIGPLAVHLFIPVIPAVKIALALSEALAQLTFSIALFTMAFATLVYGSLSDRYGRRPVLLSGLCLFLVGSAISALADSVLALVFGRVIQAIGAGCGVTLVRAIAQDVYGRERLVKAIAYLTMAYTIGPMVAPLVGGILVDAFGWRSVFGFALLAGAIVTLCAYLVVFESHPPAPANPAGRNVLRDYVALFRHLRFTAFVLQSGLCTAAFLVTATAASSLMKEMLHRPSAEFGVYFLLYPFGFLTGNFITSRIGTRIATETMVLAGSLLVLATIAAQSSLQLSGYVTPFTLFVPGFFISLAQGISLPYAQAGAMATNPKLAGTAAGVGVFMQNFAGAAFAQLYGFLADGTVLPLAQTTAITALLGLVAGAAPFWMAKRRG
jgi:DHA1 family bicyclomycin/chloramphenicol resistance-like MFS transporter